MTPDRASVPAQDQGTGLGGDKKVSDLMGPDVAVTFDGVKAHVTGTLLSVEDFAEYSTVEDEQSGHYFVTRLSDKLAGKPITVTRKGGKPKTAQDLEWVLRVTSTDDEFTFEADGEPFMVLDFAGATLSPGLGG